VSVPPLSKEQMAIKKKEADEEWAGGRGGGAEADPQGEAEQGALLMHLLGEDRRKT
jgi:hypothetical protein